MFNLIQFKMNKIVLFLVMALITMIAITSCKDVKPEFKFQLEIDGEAADSATAIQGDFNVNVCNNAVAFMDMSETNVLSIAAPEGNDANDWLDNYIQTNVISELPNSTEYVINVKGYVYDTLTGMMFSADKTFTNKIK